MSYAAYGLDDTKKAKDDDVLVKEFWCVWCNENHITHNCFNLCFSNWVICHRCVVESKLKQNKKRWEAAENCFKCKQAIEIGYSSSKENGSTLHLCESCMNWADEVLTNQEKYYSKMVQEILKKCVVEGNVVKLPNEQLERKLYTEVKKQLELIGGKWKGGKTMGFVFEEDPTELLEQLADGEQRNLKKEFQFFATPKEIAKTMITMAFPFVIEGLNCHILEPSAGDGALIKAFREQHGYHFQVDCYELMGLNRTKLLKLDGVKIIGNDFIEAALNGRVNNKYDYIIANPPFTKNQDIDHILCMYKACKPGGTIVTLSSMSWKIGSQKKQEAFREWLTMLSAQTVEIEEGAFKESGTNIKTLLIQIKKPLTEIPNLPFMDGFIKPTVLPVNEFGVTTNEQLIDEAIDSGFVNARLSNNQNSEKKENELPEPEVILQQLVDTEKDIQKNLSELQKMLSPQNHSDMIFFQNFYEMLDGIDVNINIKRKNGKLTISVLPQTTATIQPAIITGTPEELDAGFFETIRSPIEQAKGLKINLDNFKKSVHSAEQKAAETPKKEEPKPDNKKAKPKEKNPKVEVSKEVQTKIVEPILFPEE